MSKWKVFGLIIVSCAVLVKVSGEVPSNENDIHEDEQQTNLHGTFMVGHPTGYVAHPASVIQRASAPANITDHKVEDKITDILHGVLQKYDSRIRPLFMESPLLITVSLVAFQVVEVAEENFELSTAFILQQRWFDQRLAFEDDGSSSGITYININQEHTRELWLPDTYVKNEKKSEMMNDAVVLHQDGAVTRSMRLAVTSFCRFNHEDFPFDSQHCQLVIGSNTYSSKSQELQYQWEESFLAGVSNILERGFMGKTGKFSIVSVEVEQSSNKNTSQLVLSVSLQRVWRPFLTRFYLPLVLFVFVSVLCLFFQDSRISLVVNLINLALLNIFSALLQLFSKDIPSSTNKTALDSYSLMCLMFMLLSVSITLLKLSNFKQRLPRRNRRMLNDDDAEEQSQHQSNENESIYRSPSYPLRASTRSANDCLRTSCKGCGWWVYHYYRWGILVLFLVCDYIYFRVHSVNYR